MEKLNDKQLRFIEEYLIDSNATRAYIAAGYSEKLANTNATKLLQNTIISNEIKLRQQETLKKLTKTREDIVNDLVTVIDTFLLDPRNTNNALKAIEILNKMLGLNSPDKTEILHQGVVINYINPNKNNE